MEENKGFGEDNNEKQKNKANFPQLNNKKNIKLWIYIIAFAIFIIISYIDFGGSSKEINRDRFQREMLTSGDVDRIVIVNKDRVDIYINPDKLEQDNYRDAASRSKGIGFSGPSSPQYYFKIGDIETFERQLEEAQKNLQDNEKVTAEYDSEHNYLASLLGWIFPFALLFAIWFFIFKKVNGGAGGGGSQIFNIGKSKAQVFDKEKHVKVTFKDVAGLEEAKVEIMEIVDFLKQSEKYTKLGGKIPKGALLVGPPGTGKTLLAKAVAGEAHVPFFSLSGSDFVEMFVGVGASRVRDLFKQAKSKAPCIIFIDEIDAIGRARGRNPNFGGNDERENTLNQLLTEMDGFDTNGGVIILAATNRADILDKALLRAGRFDRQIHLELPDIVEREEIFKVHTKKLKMSANVDIDFLAKQTPGFSGADIANVCNEAALIAARNNKPEIEKQDFLDAVDRIIGGLERKTKIISTQEKKTIAFHEAGHATVSWLLQYANPLLKVTIIPRGNALGAAWYLPEERQITTKEQLIDEMCSALGGRASEEIVFEKISTGALNDLEKVTKQAIAMVSYFGMSSKVGNLSYYDSSGQNEYGYSKPYSERTSETIDTEVKRIIEEQYERAIKILRDNISGLTELAETLLEKEVIFSDDLERIFGKRKWKTQEEIRKEEEEQLAAANLNADENKKEENAIPTNDAQIESNLA